MVISSFFHFKIFSFSCFGNRETNIDGSKRYEEYHDTKVENKKISAYFQKNTIMSFDIEGVHL